MIWFVLQIILLADVPFKTGNGRRYKTDVNDQGEFLRAVGNPAIGSPQAMSVIGNLFTGR
jgi:hypothetical protein